MNPLPTFIVHPKTLSHFQLYEKLNLPACISEYVAPTSKGLESLEDHKTHCCRRQMIIALEKNWFVRI
jgi:hypothetical protein